MGRGAGLEISGITSLLRRYPRFELIRILGSGSFGTVAEVFDNSKRRHVALKFISGGLRMRNVEREILNHRALHHPHIIEYKEVFAIRRYLVIVMEYANGGDLFDYVAKNGQLTENEARSLYQQLIIAVDYCHRRKVSLRDIKCENLLIHYDAEHSKMPLLKLCDFGFSYRRTAEAHTSSIVGSWDYMPPEVILNEEREDYIAEQYDIWSCGVVLYIMLVGHYPFSPAQITRDDENYQSVLQERIKALDLRIPSYISSEAADFIRLSLCPAENRITTEEILRHPWFIKGLLPSYSTLNAELLNKDETTMRKVEKHQSENTVKEIIQKVYFGDDSANALVVDESFPKLFDHEIKISNALQSTEIVPEEPVAGIPITEKNAERKGSCITDLFAIFNWK